MLRLHQMSRNKAKGTSAETAVVNYLIARGYVHAERRALAGVNDKGDVAGLPGVCIEVKAHKTYSIPAWLKELAVEKVNAKATVGFLVVKPVGVGLTNTGAWWAIMPLEQAVDLLDKAGAGK
jgi:Holliday junction resolvase